MPTLWQAAHQGGLRTASVGWPVSVGSTDIDFLIPEYWRIFHPTEDLNPSDRHLIAAMTRPSGMLERMQQRLGPYLMGNDVSAAADEIKTNFAIDILHREKPQFMTVHLSSVDEAEHEHGPFSAEADQNLELVDGMLARLVSAATAEDPAAIAVVVSDHGFEPLTHRVNLAIPFVNAGLMSVTVDQATQLPQVTSWTAQPWLAGGMAAVMLQSPGDPVTVARVRDLLNKMAADPQMGIAEILDAAALQKRGAFPGAAFLITMQPGYYIGSALSGEVVAGMPGRGGHGFAPDDPAMRAAFFAAGAGIAPHRNLGLVDMRQIAPTIAQLLHVALPTAAAVPLPVRQ